MNVILKAFDGTCTTVDVVDALNAGVVIRQVGKDTPMRVFRYRDSKTVEIPSVFKEVNVARIDGSHGV